jgi:hypothetical protein
MNTIELKEEYANFLISLRDSGITNMFGASPYLADAFPELSRGDAVKVLALWMASMLTKGGK